MSNAINAIIIIIIILILVGLITVTINISQIRKNWDDYKCNPIFIPFSKIFSSKSASETFNTCINNYVKNFMKIFLSPFLDIFNNFISYGNIITSFLENFKNLVNIFKIDLGAFKEYFQEIINTVIDTMEQILNSIQDALGGIKTILELIQKGYLQSIQGIDSFLDTTSLGALIMNLDTL